jgi:hypothetical protein
VPHTKGVRYDSFGWQILTQTALVGTKFLGKNIPVKQAMVGANAEKILKLVG